MMRVMKINQPLRHASVAAIPIERGVPTKRGRKKVVSRETVGHPVVPTRAPEPAQVAGAVGPVSARNKLLDVVHGLPRVGLPVLRVPLKHEARCRRGLVLQSNGPPRALALSATRQPAGLTGQNERLAVGPFVLVLTENLAAMANPPASKVLAHPASNPVVRKPLVPIPDPLVPEGLVVRVLVRQEPVPSDLDRRALV
jgi:hypothetical protein